MTKRVGVILSGCGNRDGGEIRETLFTLLALDKLGAEAVMMAPDIECRDTINYMTGESSPERRNVLVESARVARGDIRNIRDIDVEKLDALIIPGGLGVAKNLSNYIDRKKSATFIPEVEKIILDIFNTKKPIGAICIAPAVLSTLLGQYGIEVTIGADEATINIIESTGAKHHIKRVDECCIDVVHKISSTPAYMYGNARLSELQIGIEKCVGAVLEMV
jgi:enhancing lycopene biosynthesis protein 2